MVTVSQIDTGAETVRKVRSRKLDFPYIFYRCIGMRDNIGQICALARAKLIVWWGHIETLIRLQMTKLTLSVDALLDRQPRVRVSVLITAETTDQCPQVQADTARK